jgi:hypothetical protein
MNSIPRRRVHPGWWLALSWAIVLIPLLGIGGKFGYEVVRWQRFRAERDAIGDLVETWRTRPPSGLDPHVWEEAWIVAYNGFGNVCFSPDHVSQAEMQRLQHDLEARRSGPVTPETLDWFWHRLAETGPQGAEYIARMQPLWEEAARQIQEE